MGQDICYVNVFQIIIISPAHLTITVEMIIILIRSVVFVRPKKRMALTNSQLRFYKWDVVYTLVHSLLPFTIL